VLLLPSFSRFYLKRCFDWSSPFQLYYTNWQMKGFEMSPYKVNLIKKGAWRYLLKTKMNKNKTLNSHSMVQKKREKKKKLYYIKWLIKEEMHSPSKLWLLVKTDYCTSYLILAYIYIYIILVSRKKVHIPAFM
jgi:hypothetical protein